MNPPIALSLRDGATLAYRAIEPAIVPKRRLSVLHGVGGNETSVIPLGSDVAPDTLAVFPRAERNSIF